jgi:hypothetical protein
MDHRSNELPLRLSQHLLHNFFIDSFFHEHQHVIMVFLYLLKPNDVNSDGKDSFKTLALKDN